MKDCNECHNCGSIWSPGTEEHDYQVCSSCGWRPGNPIVDQDDDEILDEDWEEERNDTNDSRNL